MALPTNTELIALDFAYNAQPFVMVPTNASVPATGMDLAYQSEPVYVGATGGGAQPFPAHRMLMIF